MLALFSLVLLVLAPAASFAVHDEDIQALDNRLKKLEELQAAKTSEKKIDISGWIRARYHFSNFNNSGAGQSLPGDKSLPNGDETANFGESRQMFFITPSFGDYVSGQLAFTTDFVFGDEAFGVGGVSGGGLKSRSVNLKTKDINMTVKFPGTNLSGTFGLQNIKDAYNGILLGWPDGAGAHFNYKAADNMNLLASWYRFWQPTGRIKQNVPVDFWRGEVAYAPQKNLDLGFNLYLLSDRSGINSTAGDPGVLGGPPIGSTRNGFAPLAYNASTGHESLVGDNQYSMWVMWPGVNFNYRVSNFTIDGFFIYQTGKFDAISAGIHDVTLNSLAANLGASTQLGATNVKLSGIYVLGDAGNDNPSIGIKKKGFYTPGSWSLSGSWMGLTGMKTLFPDLDATSQDQALVYDVTNTFEQRPLGIKTLLLTTDTKLSDKVNLEAGIGTLSSDKKRIVNGKTYMGTELNAGIHYKPWKQFSIGLQTAYTFIGDFYKVTDAQAAAYNATATGNPVSANRDPANAWLMYVRTNYAF